MMGALAELKDRKRRKSAKAASDADVRPSILPNGESVVYDLCWHCTSSGANLLCGQCSVARYCNKGCQKASWGKGGWHKKTCKQWKGTKTEKLGKELGEGVWVGDVATLLFHCGGWCELGTAASKMPIDLPQAARFYTSSAEMGNTNAICNLATMYDTGNGVPQDKAMAASWYQKAADQDSSHAAYNLAIMYKNAKGNLGVMYANGHGCKQSYEKAVALYREAVLEGNSSAECNLGDLYRHGTYFEQDYETAAAYYKSAGNDGMPDAQINLAEMYEHGLGVERDNEEAVRWYRRAADQGNADAMAALAKMYDKGCGVTRSVVDARLWRNRAIAEGTFENPMDHCMYAIAKMYQRGDGSHPGTISEIDEGNEFFEAEIDYAKAKEYFEAFGEFDYRFVFQQRYYDLAMFLLAESEKNDKANASGTPEHREKQVWINLQFRVLWLKIRADTAYEGQTIGMSAKPMLYLKAFGFEIDIAKVRLELEIPDQSNRQLLEEQKEALVQEKKKFMAKHLSKEPEDLYRDMTETIDTEVPGAGSRPIRLGKVFSNAQVRSVEYQLGWDGLGKRQDRQELTSGSKPPQTLTSEEMGLLQAQGDAAV
eukprot:gene3437-22189_t